MRFWGIEFLPHFAGALYTVLRVFVWLFTLGALYSWLTVSLGLFPYTQPWGKQLGGYVFRFFGILARRHQRAPRHLLLHCYFPHHAMGDTPGQGVFRQVSSGAPPRLVDGSRRSARDRADLYIRGLGVCSSGGLSLHTWLKYGGLQRHQRLFWRCSLVGFYRHHQPDYERLFVVYSKALKTGDWVVVNEKEGQVLEVGLLAVKIRTIEEQEVTIPNSVIVNTTTTNFTRLGKLDGSVANVTVTIGYDAPWRQVHALLLLGSERTANMRKSPAPYVVQRALSDFYAEYTLIVHLESERLRVETLSSLHANIQDAFNEFGVQIMSPHFMMQPQQNIVVDRSNWYAAPARSGTEQPAPGCGQAFRSW